VQTTADSCANVAPATRKGPGNFTRDRDGREEAVLRGKDE
jgi:hypothetical protein